MLDDPKLQETARKAALPFRIVEEMGVPCGYERSFKVRESELLANRFLLGLSIPDLPAGEPENACRRLGMPDEHLDVLREHLPGANGVLIGFEDDERRCSYRVYLEFWDRARRLVETRPNHREPILLGLGLKWNADDVAQRTVSRYRWYPGMTTPRIIHRIRRIFRGRNGADAAAIAVDLVRRATAGRGAPPRYLEAGDEGGPRCSFDVNLYRTGVRIGQLGSTLSRLRACFSLPPDRFRRLEGLIADKRLGHVAGGTDRLDRGFLSIYYEA